MVDQLVARPGHCDPDVAATVAVVAAAAVVVSSSVWPGTMCGPSRNTSDY